MRHLSFEDFLEAIVRLSGMLALPTDVELAESGAADAGEWLLTLQVKAPSEFAAFVERRRTTWDGEPRQKIHRCVDHLVTYFIRIIERNSCREYHGAEDHVASLGEVEAFEAKRRKGGRLFVCDEAAHRDEHDAAADYAFLEHFRQAAAIVRARLLHALRRVDVFSGLSNEQLETLGEAFTDAPFEENAFVFEQGDAGDAFYVITEGTAECLRVEAPDSPEVVLAELAEGSYFGERALLKSDVRYAGIRASSSKLLTMCITRERFEATLGPLKDFIRDVY